MNIIGITRSHNGAVSILRNGQVQVGIQAERLTRQKRQFLTLENDAENISRTVRYCLEACGLDYADIDAIATSTPWEHIDVDAAKFETLIGGSLRPNTPIVTVPHHLTHAEYALHYSDLEPGLVAIVDGSGTYEKDRARFTIQENRRDDARIFAGPESKETLSSYAFDGDRLELVYRMGHPPVGVPESLGYVHNARLMQSFGHLWEWAAWYCCGSVRDPGKVMGLAAHGNPQAHDGSTYAYLDAEGRLQIAFERLYETFTEPNLGQNDISGNKHFADVAAMVQERTNTLLVELLGRLQKSVPARTLYYAGGVALNVVANEVIVRSGLFDRVYMNGSCEDNGTAIGACLAAQHYLSGGRSTAPVREYYGRTYTNTEIADALTEAGCPHEKVTPDELIDRAANALNGSAVIGWFQGGSEFGPRALGNRSILANPIDPHTKYILDLLVKRRERYRPYAPAVLAERVQDYFDIEGPSPVMLREGRVNVDTLPGITHIDGSARVQTVARGDNQRYYDLIKRFGELSGIPVILNTSYNLAGEPIVESPADAIRSFLASRMRVLFIGDYIATRPG